MQIEVERVAIGQRSREVWTLSVDVSSVPNRIRVRLDHWEPQERRTPDSPWIKAGEGYRRQGTPGAASEGYWLSQTKVPWGGRIMLLVQETIAARTVLVGPDDLG